MKTLLTFLACAGIAVGQTTLAQSCNVVIDGVCMDNRKLSLCLDGFHATHWITYPDKSRSYFCVKNHKVSAPKPDAVTPETVQNDKTWKGDNRGDLTTHKTNPLCTDQPSGSDEGCKGAHAKQ